MAVKNNPTKKTPKTSKSLDNLNKRKLFMPGHDPRRNMAGRPKKGKIIGEAMREVLSGQEVRMSLTVDGKTKELSINADKNFAYGVAAITLREAMKGNMAAIKELADRVDGKPFQSIGVAPELPDETPIPREMLAEMWEKLNGGKK